MKKLFTVLLSLAMLAIPASLFAGCGPASGSDTIVFAIGSDWGSLDPYTSTNSMTGHYLTVDKIYDKLVYIDEEGDLVTSIVNGKDCVFTCYDKGGMCQCAIEKAFRQGKTSFYKPISCHLYPIRIKQFGEYTAVNLHKWKICKAAAVLGRKEGVKAYQFLKEPLIRKFGKAWYEQLEAAVKELPQLK